MLGYFRKRAQIFNRVRKYGSNSKRSIILGIETSCDDTGCAIVDSNRNVLGEALHSQQQLHLNNGGIIPPIAQDLHRENIENVVSTALSASGLSFEQIDAVATTVKPGLPLSLVIGMKYGKYLSRKFNKPFIPIHHMEAHALTSRMYDPTLEYPFLVLLISGGHALLAVVNRVDEFLLLGESLDDAPGEALDKTARRLKIHNLPEYRSLCGGAAVEKAASKATDPFEFEFPSPLAHYRDCNFSFAGTKNTALRHIVKEEKKYDLAPDQVIPSVNNLCAALQFSIARHLCQRVQRATEFIEINKILPENRKNLVVSGGAACNNFIYKALQVVSSEKKYKLIRPTPKLCTDNGIMIAWNGVEKWLAKTGICTNLDEVDIQGKCPLGVSWKDKVAEAKIKCQWVKLKSLVNNK